MLSYFEKYLNTGADKSNDQEFWDNKSNKFKKLFPNIDKQRDDCLFDTLEREHILDNVSSMVDIGCGIGRHSYYFSQNVDSYVGIDSSTKMIELAMENKKKHSLNNCEFRQMSWHESNDKYDMVFACMCPGIKRTSDIQKLLDMSNRYVVIKRFLKEEMGILSELLEINENHAHNDAGYTYGLINILWKLSYIPQVFTMHEETESVFNIDNIMSGKQIVLNYREEDQKQKNINLLKQQADVNGNIMTVIKRDHALIVVDKNMVSKNFK